MEKEYGRIATGKESRMFTGIKVAVPFQVLADEFIDQQHLRRGRGRDPAAPRAAILPLFQQLRHLRTSLPKS